MYRRNIAAAAAVLFLSSAVGISAYAAPQKDNSATEAETELKRKLRDRRKPKQKLRKPKQRQSEKQVLYP